MPVRPPGLADRVDANVAPQTERPRTDVAAKRAALAAARRDAGLASGEYDQLRAALLRATGAGDTDAARALDTIDIDLQRLRSDPAAKRALWPHLRRLRRERRG